MENNNQNNNDQINYTEPPKVKKTSELKKFFRKFFYNDFEAVKEKAVNKIIDGVKSTILDSVQAMLFGNTKPQQGKQNDIPKVSYWKAGQNSNQGYGRVGLYEYNNIMYATYEDAEEALNKLIELIRAYDSVSVEQYMSIVGKRGSYTDRKWGWTNLSTVRGPRCISPGTWVLDLPEPIPISIN